jgi:hypothetical protein
LRHVVTLRFASLMCRKFAGVTTFFWHLPGAHAVEGCRNRFRGSALLSGLTMSTVRPSPGRADPSGNISIRWMRLPGAMRVIRQAEIGAAHFERTEDCLRLAKQLGRLLQHNRPDSDIDASFEHLLSTAKQRERNDDAERLGWLFKPVMIVASSKEAPPSGFYWG